jgi:methionyl-tRNA synthetase
VGCELEKTDSELERGKCPLHPNQELEIIEEENYFFRFSKYQDKLLRLYKENPKFVVPKFRLKEIRNFVEKGLEDFSVSRLKEKMPWGIDVPGDPEQVMYVWFDALIFYISSIGWPDKADFDGYWPGVQIAGKDNLRQQSAIWQAMLMSAGLPNTKQILIHGFIQSGGQKMSKSLGNVIDPLYLSKKYGADALRYYLLAKIHPFNDSDFTIKDFERVYNGELANGLGNLVSRVENLAYKNKLDLSKLFKDESLETNETIDDLMTNYRFDQALDCVWIWIHALDRYIDQKRPWEKLKDESNRILWKIIVGSEAVNGLKRIAQTLLPFLPETAEEIIKRFDVKIIKKVGKPLFPRL